MSSPWQASEQLVSFAYSNSNSSVDVRGEDRQIGSLDQHRHQDRKTNPNRQGQKRKSASLSLVLCVFWFCARASRNNYSRLRRHQRHLADQRERLDLHTADYDNDDELGRPVLPVEMCALESPLAANQHYKLYARDDDHNHDDHEHKTNGGHGRGVDFDLDPTIGMIGMHDQAAKNRAKFAFKSYTIALATPKRGRSLVEDARQDSQRNRQLLLRLTQDRSTLSGGSFGSSADGHAPQADPSVATTNGTCTEDDAVVEGVRSLIEQQQHEYPRHISQLDECNHLLIKYEPELDPTHPGYHDLEYRERRKRVAQIAFDYRHGQPIPEVEYEQRELATWGYIYERLKVAYAKYACRQHLDAIERLERECGYSPAQVPQLQRVSDFLARTTGWRLRPAAGLLTARDFLASLAFRVFQTTQYIRHWGNPEHSVEPDCIHELMGHIPMLCDEKFARFSQQLGLASLGAPDDQIERFATLYWFTVEFGLCREGPERALKCYGAGLLSSYGEMHHALESQLPALREFDPEQTALETYDDAEYQVAYYVANSFDDAMAKLKDYADRHLERPYELYYDPYTCSVRQLDSLGQLDRVAEALSLQVGHLSAAIAKLARNQHRSCTDRHEQRKGAHN